MPSISVVAPLSTLHIVTLPQATLCEVRTLFDRSTHLWSVSSLSYEGNWMGKDRRKRYQWLHVSISWGQDDELLNPSLNFDCKHSKTALLLVFLLFQSRHVNKKQTQAKIGTGTTPDMATRIHLIIFCAQVSTKDWQMPYPCSRSTVTALMLVWARWKKTSRFDLLRL